MSLKRIVKYSDLREFAGKIIVFRSWHSHNQKSPYALVSDTLERDEIRSKRIKLADNIGYSFNYFVYPDEKPWKTCVSNHWLLLPWEIRVAATFELEKIINDIETGKGEFSFSGLRNSKNCGPFGNDLDRIRHFLNPSTL